MTNNNLKTYLPLIFTVSSAIGVGVTAILAAKGHKKACDILDKTEFDTNSTPRERAIKAVKLTGKEYAPAIVAGAATVGMIFAANNEHVKLETGLAGVIGVIGARLSDTNEEILKKFGDKEFQDIQDRITAREMAEHNEMLDRIADNRNGGGELYYEAITGQSCRMTEEQLCQLELGLNEFVKENGCAYVTDYIHMIPDKSLRVPAWCDRMGWFPGDKPFEEQAPFTGGYIYLHRYEKDGMTAIRPCIMPMPQSPIYQEIIKGNIAPFRCAYYDELEPGDQLQLPEDEELMLAMNE